MSERNKGNPNLWEDSVKLCLSEKLLSVYQKVSQYLTVVKNEKTREYISIDNIQLIRDLLKKSPKIKP